MVEIGGEIVVNGVSENKCLGILVSTSQLDDSTNTVRKFRDVLDITDIAMATSGNYRNFYYKNGKKYAHTIDPKQAIQYSITSYQQRFCKELCYTADAYATSFMVMGMEGANRF